MAPPPFVALALLAAATGPGLALAWAPASSPRSTTSPAHLGRAASKRAVRMSSESGSGGKGFGNVKPPPPPKKKSSGMPEEVLLGAPPPSESSFAAASDAAAAEGMGSPAISKGAREALDQMKAKRESDRAARAGALAERIEARAEVQEELAANPTAGVIPDKVAKRMLFRMLPLAATPIFGGIALFVYFYLSATKGDTEFQPTVVAYATTVPWLLGLFGLTFGLLSTSWDEDVEGSFLGLDELSTNLGRLTEGVKRGAENQELRDIEEKQRRQQ